MEEDQKDVEIELDRPRRLRLNHLAAAKAERELKRITGDWISFPQIMARIKVSAQSELIVLLWAALVHEDNDLTQDQVADALDGIPLNVLHDKLQESFDKNFPPMIRQPGEKTDG